MESEVQDNYFKGRGAQINTPNPYFHSEYVREHIEGLDGEMLENSPTQYINTYPKTIVNKVESPDLAMMYSMNPYQGCEHGCIYCYARNAHQYWGYSAGLDFERKIIIKKNAPLLLKRFFERKNWEPSPIMLSGNTDCYQPIERKLKITHRLLEVCLEYKNPISIITKNALVLRDIDLLSEMNKYNLINVNVSLNSLNESLRQAMEPRTVTAKGRLKVISQLAANAIPVRIMVAPIIPGLNSDEIPKVIKAAADAGVNAAGFTIVRLNGAIGDIFTDWVHKAYPDRAEKVLNQIKACHGGQLNDSRYNTRTRGEGKEAEMIRNLYHMSVKKYLAGREMKPLDCSQFRKPSDIQLNLF